MMEAGSQSKKGLFNGGEGVQIIQARGGTKKKKGYGRVNAAEL